jgi:hypothetical protein
MTAAAANGARIAMRDANDDVHYLTQDHLGGTALVADETGDMTARVRYYPYGQLRTEEGTLNTDKLYTGQQRETTNGIYQLQGAVYDAQIATATTAAARVHGSAPASPAYLPAEPGGPSSISLSYTLGWWFTGELDLVGFENEVLAELDVAGYFLASSGFATQGALQITHAGVPDRADNLLGWDYKDKRTFQAGSLHFAVGYYHENKLGLELAGDTALVWAVGISPLTLLPEVYAGYLIENGGFPGDIVRVETYWGILSAFGRGWYIPPTTIERHVNALISLDDLEIPGCFIAPLVCGFDGLF